ncbi:undecaprenyl-phosphate alpha-N-acetylglucosaminyl 1-phosphate transferase [Desulfuribacillus alkaliarsenatis]|uniref:Undecaprenyl-phosphate alpha-N-acetylglucosaminyl 1-phosphate transferase n=1 Tax=Desulfuribacillus alkaliarsenatis TaxID=766136 RepID=A0A1E5G3M1_9FIRM|nr:undecaprenyl-phosphate alpha-N-acetylglucosaminyl 1-phosphate transferase [Desulfuribacillus alkaliarsenatis]
MIYGVFFVIAFGISFLITPQIKKLAIAIGAVDQPEQRKVHSKVMPRMGGLAICLAFFIPLIMVLKFNILHISSPIFTEQQIIGFLIGGAIIILVGLIDDKYQISAKYKFLGQLIAASIVIYSGIQVQFITLPDQGVFEFGWLSIPITLLWIIGITNALNLIDGLDGLAAGVASIALATISIIGFAMGNVIVAFMALLLLASTLGFLVHNFYPAKIFMGDTGALFLGYNLAIFSILGFKHVTLISFIIPILILGVPIADTLFAIVRRFLSKQAISEPDKHHLHHCLLKMGCSHRQTVLIIYTISMFFSATAIIFTQAEAWMALTILGLLFIVFAIGADVINILNRRERFIVRFIEDSIGKQIPEKQNYKANR